MQGVCRPGALLGVSGVRPVLPLWPPPPLGWALLTRTSGPAALVAPGPCRVSTLPLLGDKLPGAVTATPGPGACLPQGPPAPWLHHQEGSHAAGRARLCPEEKLILSSLGQVGGFSLGRMPASQRITGEA